MQQRKCDRCVNAIRCLFALPIERRYAHFMFWLWCHEKHQLLASNPMTIGIPRQLRRFLKKRIIVCHRSLLERSALTTSTRKTLPAWEKCTYTWTRTTMTPQTNIMTDSMLEANKQAGQAMQAIWAGTRISNGSNEGVWAIGYCVLGMSECWVCSCFCVLVVLVSLVADCAALLGSFSASCAELLVVGDMINAWRRTNTVKQKALQHLIKTTVQHTFYKANNYTTYTCTCLARLGVAWLRLGWLGFVWLVDEQN